MIGWGSTALLASAGALAIGALSFVVYQVLAAEESPFSGLLGEYEERLESHTRFLLVSYSGAQIARLQLIVCLVLGAMSLVLKSATLFCFVAMLAVLPAYWLWKQHQARIAKLEEQLDGWLLLLANALKATPSIGEAIESTVRLVARPFSEELDLVVKEYQLGAPIDRAVQQMARRVDSPIVSGALATIVIARNTGGNLPAILETTGETLREAARLEGVFRTKTSEARGQIVVLAVAPFALWAVISTMDPTWFEPLQGTRLGTLFLLGGLTAWASAVLWAKNIVDFDV